MANTKIIKKRISSIRSTRKIARTIEMVSTTKSKKQVDKLLLSRPYQKKLEELMSNIQSLGNQEIESPFLEERKIQKSALIVVTANRGLCGAYNTNILKMAVNVLQTKKDRGELCDLYVIGKKGISYFKYINIEIKEAFTDIHDGTSYQEVEKFIEPFLQKFKDATYDEVRIISTVFYSSASQKPNDIPFLPLQLKSEPHINKGNTTTETATHLDTHKLKINYLYEPEPQKILKELIPLAIKTKFYSYLLQAFASEHISRRIAMKNATDAASDMLKNLTRDYNRARQASITQELAEIVAGADAI